MEAKGTEYVTVISSVPVRRGKMEVEAFSVFPSTYSVG
jgi:hypothetical protein